MGSLTNQTNNDNFQHNDIDLGKVFIRDNRYLTGQYKNDDYDAVTLTIGTLLGRNSTTGMLIPLFGDAADGSQFPVGFLAHTITVAEDDTVNLTYCHKGDVVEERIILDDADTLEITIGSDSRRLRDLISDLGINLISRTELTEYDNS